jgi:hypothetical protein
VLGKVSVKSLSAMTVRHVLFVDLFGDLGEAGDAEVSATDTLPQTYGHRPNREVFSVDLDHGIAKDCVVDFQIAVDHEPIGDHDVYSFRCKMLKCT